MIRACRIYGNGGQLTQAVLNLVRNAWQACGDSGLILLRTRVLRQFTLGGNRHKLVCALQVSDDGPGVPEDLLPSLFLPLVRAMPKARPGPVHRTANR